MEITLWLSSGFPRGTEGEEATIAGCLIAQLDKADGRCTHFREYWFDIEGHLPAFDGWGE